MTARTFDYRPPGEGPSDGFLKDGWLFETKASHSPKAAQSMEHAVMPHDLIYYPTLFLERQNDVIF